MMTKNLAYVLPLVTLYVFTFGYVYEWGYLSGFNVANEIVNHSYSEFLVLATHALTVALRSGNAIVVVFTASLLIALAYSVPKLNAFQTWVAKIRVEESEFHQFFANFITICLFPFSLIIIFLLPGLLGHYEAIALKKSSAEHWQEIEIAGNPPLKIQGITIRSFGGRVFFYEKDDPITHLIPLGEVNAIRSRTTSHNKAN